MHWLISYPSSLTSRIPLLSLLWKKLCNSGLLDRAWNQVRVRTSKGNQMIDGRHETHVVGHLFLLENLYCTSRICLCHCAFLLNNGFWSWAGRGTIRPLLFERLAYSMGLLRKWIICCRHAQYNISARTDVTCNDFLASKKMIVHISNRKIRLFESPFGPLAVDFGLKYSPWKALHDKSV